MTANSPTPPQTVSIGLDTTYPNKPSLTYSPSEFQGKVLAPRNGIALQFFGSNPFALIVLGKTKGPVNDVKSPFGKIEVLKSVKDDSTPDYPWYIDPKDTIVRIPPGQWGDYEFCYVVVMATGIQAVPILISDDPKIIIGRETSVSDEGTPTPPPPTPEELLNMLFPGTGSV